MPPYIPKYSTLAQLAKIPAIPARPRDLIELYTRLRALLDRLPPTRLLSVLKYVAYIVLLLNIGSLPFVWHLRVFWYIITPRLRYLVICLKFMFAKKARTRALIAWAEDLCPVGANPFELCTVYKRWASIDDIDMFGMHLSNSSYAKAFDSARAKMFVNCFPACGRSGGQMALGATHFYFIREIPPLVRYEVRLTIGSWDHKWLYLVARYVTRSNRRYADNVSPQSTSTPPTPTPNNSLASAQNGSANVEHAVAAIIHTDNSGIGNTRRAPMVEPDGTILHCVAVSQICFKWGRITIPPAIVMASEGLTKPYGDGHCVNNKSRNTSPDVRSCSYSRTNPPPNWIKSQSIRVPPHGSMDDFRAFLGGKWRDVPEGERWWEDVLGGSIEVKRQANLETLESLKLGLERTRTLR